MSPIVGRGQIRSGLEPAAGAGLEFEGSTPEGLGLVNAGFASRPPELSNIDAL